jgi:hypothetical protein
VIAIVLGEERVEWLAVMARALDLLMRLGEFFFGILEKQKAVADESSFFRIRALISRWFCFSRILSEAASPNRRCSQRDAEALTSRLSEARPRFVCRTSGALYYGRPAMYISAW